MNLDALIERADFEAEADASQSNQVAINIQHLERDNSFFLRSLRKPDFQRETASWEPEQVRDFIGTFIEGDFYPAILLWLSKRGAFVIDGAHRLSALIAWVENDYGDGKTSQAFFGVNISDDQVRYAEETRQLVEKKFGKYEDYFSILHPAPNSRPIDAVMEKRAVGFGQRAIATQLIPGDAQKAEKSFFKINRSATLIDKIELDILKARRRPTGIAARAMLRAGSGYKYWRAFDPETRAQIERQAEEIYMQLWTPILTVPIRTPNLPVAGSNYSAYTLALLFQFIALANEQPGEVKKKRSRRSVT
ncbi:MAG TPA: DUF262 domain-containing protein, partial [Candidatus Binataceae bacterium]|nr:DUF262 domain-containing protein [Candidatus Binataceae bacterium]